MEVSMPLPGLDWNTQGYVSTVPTICIHRAQCNTVAGRVDDG